jgi:hypothetical protein
MRLPLIFRRFASLASLKRDIDRSLVRRKDERRRSFAQAPTEMQRAARKGAATKRRQRRERDPLLEAVAP